MLHKDLSKNSWIKIYQNFCSLSEQEFENLWSLRPSDNSYVKIMGRDIKIPRKQSLFGNKTYRFSGKTVVSKSIENEFMKKILDKINSMESEHNYDHIFVNWYEDGSEYIGYHSDNEKDLISGAPIYSLSLGATRKFKIKNKISKEVIDIVLDDGMLVVMGGDMQKEFWHSIPKTTKCQNKRINLTFRAFS